MSFYKKHRAILDSDIIHVRRPDGRDIDCMMHVNSELRERALAMVYNPSDREVTTVLELPLYYSGLTSRAMVREREGKAREYRLDRDDRISVPLRVEARGITWLLIEE